VFDIFAFQGQKGNRNRIKRKVKTASPGNIVPCHNNWSQSSSLVLIIQPRKKPSRIKE